MADSAQTQATSGEVVTPAAGDQPKQVDDVPSELPVIQQSEAKKEDSVAEPTKSADTSVQVNKEVVQPAVEEISKEATAPLQEVAAEKKPEASVVQGSEVKKEAPAVEATKPAESAQPEVAKLETLASEQIKKEEALSQPAVEGIKKEAIVPAEEVAGTSKDNDWQHRELALLKKIEELEKVRNARSEDGLKLELKVREEEIDLLRARVRNLETELQAALSKPTGKNHEMIENIKQQHEELLSKARGMIFDKTKMVKNQELQIEALTTQVQSLKDINLITKDLLEIRNSEVKAMEDRLQAMEARFKAEKDKYGLVLQRAQTSSSINDDLRKEYETQLAIFKELREKYEQRVQALVAENARLKASAPGPAS